MHLRIIFNITVACFRGAFLAWLSAFSRGRTGYVVVSGVKGAVQRLRRGAPQGTVSAPDLFGIYVDDIPDALDLGTPDVVPSLYADDVAVTVVGDTPAKTTPGRPGPRRPG